MIIIGYFFSFLMGTVLGLIGGGGSILTVPILIYLFNFEPLLATHLSLFIVGVTASVGMLFGIKQKQVDTKAAYTFAIPSAVGVYVSRHWILSWLPDSFHLSENLIVSKAALILIAFSILMIFSSIQLKLTPNEDQTKRSWNRLIIPSLGVGCLTGFVGAGGGFLIIPALITFFGLPIKIAVSTSLLIISFNSILGFLIGGSFDQLPWNSMLSILIISITGLLTGRALQQKVNEKTLKNTFRGFVLVLGLFILIQQVLRIANFSDSIESLIF
jgi:uncharacterized membrane protein YfcA